MTPRFLLFALLAMGAGACDPTADGDDFEAPMPDAGRPGRAELPPDAGPVGEPMVEPTPGVTLRFGAASLLLILEWQGGDPESVVEVDLLDAEGEVIETLTGNPALWPIPDPWTRHLWWPVTERPAAARVRLMAGEEILREQAVGFIDDVPRAEGECDPMGFANRCAGGAACLTNGWVNLGPPGHGVPPPMDVEPGQCATLTATAWQLDDAVLVDLRADVDWRASLAPVGAPGSDGFETMVAETQVTDAG